MAKIYNVGIAGLTHDHIWGLLRKWLEQPNVRLVGIAESHEPLKERARKDFGIDKFYDTYEELIEREKLDILQITCENSKHREITEYAVSKGINVIIEKPMAESYESALRMFNSAKASGVKFMVNWPTNWNPAIRKALDMAKNGDIGKIFQFRYRAGHKGPKEIGCSIYFYSWLYDPEKNGAGAYMDFCGYGTHMAGYLLGKPLSVLAFGKNLVRDYIPAEDNAILIMEYDRAMAVAEATWSQIGNAPIENPIIYGSDGTIAVSRGEIILFLDGKEPKSIVPEELPPYEKNAIVYFLHCIENDIVPEGLSNPELSLQTQKVLSAGLESIKTKRAISIDP
ncbi:Gfo/Idh/MocA family oxidoreductase [bacterium]|nr:Gfo/Idh/MocA family oxidoreductase [bacterium]